MLINNLLPLMQTKQPGPNVDEEPDPSDDDQQPLPTDVEQEQPDPSDDNQQSVRTDVDQQQPDPSDDDQQPVPTDVNPQLDPSLSNKETPSKDTLGENCNIGNITKPNPYKQQTYIAVNVSKVLRSNISLTKAQYFRNNCRFDFVLLFDF